MGDSQRKAAPYEQFARAGKALGQPEAADAWPPRQGGPRATCRTFPTGLSDGASPRSGRSPTP